MSGDEKPTRHQLANEKQKVESLKNVLKRAADELDNLAEADCDAEAIERAEAKAEQLRRVADS